MSCPFNNEHSRDAGPAEYNKAGVYYHDYLRLQDLLTLQNPESSKGGATAAHEETLFIIIHQVYELWFKQILHEINSICELFSQPTLQERYMGVISNRLDRINSILKILVEQISVLETMSPVDFLEFRDKLTPASGFQSVQFRVIENKLGMHSKLRIQYMQTHYHEFFSDDHRQKLVDSEGQDSLLLYIIRWLERMPFLMFGEFDFWETYKKAVGQLVEKDRENVMNNPHLPPEVREVQLKELTKNEESFATLFNEDMYKVRLERGDVRFSYRAMQAALFINLYKDEPICHMPHRILTSLIETDELLTLWRYRHALMVQRMIGVKIGTGGSSGYHYLRSTVGDRYKIFIDLYNLASYFIPRSTLPKLPFDMVPQMDFVWSQRNAANTDNKHA